MTEYETRTTRVTLLPKGESIFSERATDITIEDEGGGEFVKVEQNHSTHNMDAIAIDPEEWTDLFLAIDKMIKECRSND